MTSPAPIPQARLSVCIPTYNRAAYLEPLLRSLAPQLGPDDEVVISDNASTDDTPGLVARWQETMPNLVYKRWDENRGADQNYLNVVALARGDYCWLVGSDDVPAGDAIAVIRRALASDADALLFSRMLCTAGMHVLEPHTSWAFGEDRVFQCAGEGLAEYFRTCRSITGLFSYLSGIVFRRAIWVRDEHPGRLLGSAYVHADILIRQLARGGILLASPRIIVNCRCGNDSFSDGNKGKRLSLDFDGYARIADALDPAAGLEMMRVLVREHPWRNLVHILKYQIALGPGRGERFLALLARLGTPAHQRLFYRFLALPPVFPAFELVEPWFKKDNPWRKFKRRYLNRLFRAESAA